MADPQGFLNTRERELPPRRPVPVRLHGLARGLRAPARSAQLQRQAGRCMDCGIPFCHNGCPLGNLIPEWNDLAWRGDWQRGDRAAARDEQLPGVHRAAVPGPVRDRVRARHQPAAGDDQADRGHDRRPGVRRRAGWQPQPPDRLTGKTVAVVGSRARRPGGGPAADPGRAHGRGLRAGRQDRRPAALRHPRVQDGEGRRSTAGWPRWRPRAPGSAAASPSASADHRPAAARPLRRGRARHRRDRAARPAGAGPRARRHAAGDGVPAAGQPRGARRAGRGPGHRRRTRTSSSSAAATPAPTAWAPRCARAPRSVTQLEIMPRPAEERPDGQPWPTYPMIYRVASAHEEGGERVYAVSTKEFLGDEDGRVRGAAAGRGRADGRPASSRVEGTEREIPAQLVLLAMGFTGPEPHGVGRAARRRARRARRTSSGTSTS